MATDPAKLRQSLDDIGAQARKAHGDDPRAADRLAQLDAALATAGMALEALEDEKTRRDHDRAERIRAAERGE